METKNFNMYCNYVNMNLQKAYNMHVYLFYTTLLYEISLYYKQGKFQNCCT